MLNVVVNILCIGACSVGLNKLLCIFLFIKNRVVTRAECKHQIIYLNLTFGFVGWDEDLGGWLALVSSFTLMMSDIWK